MSYEEKNQWVFGILTLASATAYALMIWSRAQAVPLTEVPYAGPMVGTIAAGVIATIICVIVLAIASPKTAGRSDVRDKEINRHGEYTGHFLVVVGAGMALVLAMLEVDYFWIANTIYAGFVLSALVSIAAKLAAYRRGFPSW